MYECILVPLDGSPVAEIALDQAAELARALRSRLVLFRVVPLPERTVSLSAPSDIPEDTGALFASDQGETVVEQGLAEEYLANLRGKLSAEGLDVSVAIGVGDVPEQILSYAKEVGATLITMSTHGKGGLKHKDIGSQANAVLKGSSIPLLVIPYR
jgi:nucleotide-binding universal stress UspA family protein